MVYEEFEPGRATPLYRADWADQLHELRQSALDAIGLPLVAIGYAWTFVQLLAHNPAFFWAPMVFPLGIGCIGLLVVLVRNSPVLRSVLFIAGGIGLGAALLAQRSAVAPFFSMAVISAASLVAVPWAALLAAGLASGVLIAANELAPGLWPMASITTALALYWVIAIVGWLTSRDLYMVLSWALHGYQDSWNTTRKLMVQRGKLTETMKALTDANALLKRTTYDLAQARVEAETARELKAQFAASISHELRTPLHLIVGFSQMMYASPESYEGVRWTPELRTDIQEIQQNAQHLLRLIDDVLDLAQVDAARLPISRERVSLTSLIQEAVDTARGLLRHRDLYLRVELPSRLPTVYADPTRMRQVLLNLLNNAMRFTDKGGITVSAEARKGEVEVVVADTGIGMEADQLTRVFDEFYQVDSSLRRRYGGTGLGLAICKHFVELHEGRIWAESRLGEGSTLHFTLPLPDSQSVRSQRSRVPTGWRYPARKPDSPRRIVALADSEDFARFLGRHLDEVEILQASGCQEAADIARRVQADAIVVAAESGGEALGEEVARATLDLAMPVIVCSAPLERGLALAAGFSHCLMKPFLPEQLVHLLERAAPDARTLLVVDDDPHVVHLIERAVKAMSPAPQVLPAYDGEMAISLLESRPDAVLLDLLLPRASGLEVLREVRRRPWAGATPVIAITAYGFEQDIAATGVGSISMKRGTQFSTSEMVRWLLAALDMLPARYLRPAGLEPAPGATATG
ncbi:MAG: ATP-binding protein [Anaerolineae bacterium]